MRSPRGGIASIAVVAATVLVVAGVDAWVASATTRGAEALSANALRSVELADDMRWQLSRLVPGPTRVEEGARRRALESFTRDVTTYEPLATFEGERPEWLGLAGLARELSADLSHGDRLALEQDTHSAVESVNRLIALNRSEAEAIGHQLLVLGRRQVVVDALAGALVVLVVAQVAGSRLRALAREHRAVAQSLELVESKNRELEAFAARAAHDLRTPLVPIHGLASLIVRANRDESDARLAGRIVGAASRMSAIIDAMLAFSRSGRLPRGRCEIGAAVNEVLEELASAVDGAELRLSVTEAEVACAPEVLGQILRNVIGNALKYRATNRSCAVEIETRVDDRWVTLEVTDNGIGMEARAARRAFEPFFRASADGNGHGLGLAIVDSYLRALGGSVQLGSEPGVGTRVSLRLPRNAPVAMVQEPVTEAAFRGTGAEQPLPDVDVRPGATG
ncbi:MAG: sensor histidine kinase [Myxococcaceae bacterium]